MKTTGPIRASFLELVAAATLLASPGALAQAITLIHDVQGPGASSPIAGASVTVRAIVTGVRSNGFFIQEEEVDYDADPMTSEGMLVFVGAAPPAAAAVGNLVEVTGTVTEFVPAQDPLQPPLTEITGPTVALISRQPPAGTRSVDHQLSGSGRPA